ncbi:hypothetical protein NQ317_007598 [Molorchus minor]|uniref:Uncharacterized protein n=1 Tax=Molorchus minor TaxID=1323400 RepID=A0ABQ9IVW0_9CUCU|nr:hypothetical protein NQ317_007598 [Molorchus minor]
MIKTVRIKKLKKNDDRKSRSSGKHSSKDRKDEKKDDKQRKSSSSSNSRKDRDKSSSKYNSSLSSSKDKDKSKDKKDIKSNSSSNKEKEKSEKEKHVKGDRDKEKGDKDKNKSSSSSRQRQRKRKESSNKDKDKEKDKVKDIDKDLTRDKDKDKDSSRDKDKDSSGDKVKDKDSRRDKDKEKDSSKTKDREKGYDREKECFTDKETSIKEKSRSSSSNTSKDNPPVAHLVTKKDKDKKRESKKESKDDHYNAKIRKIIVVLLIAIQMMDRQLSLAQIEISVECPTINGISRGQPDKNDHNKVQGIGEVQKNTINELHNENKVKKQGDIGVADKIDKDHDKMVKAHKSVEVEKNVTTDKANNEVDKALETIKEIKNNINKRKKETMVLELDKIDGLTNLGKLDGTTLIQESNISPNGSFLLPLSPAESEKSNDKKEEELPKPAKQKRTVVTKGFSTRCQRYSSDDLYKPRPTIATSRRSRASAKHPES